VRTAALLRILVKTQGAARAAQDLLSVDAAGRKASLGLDSTSKAVAGADKQLNVLHSRGGEVASQLVVVGNGGRNAADAIGKARVAAAGASDKLGAMGSALDAVDTHAAGAVSGLRDVDKEARRAKVSIGGMQGGLINTNAGFSALRNVIGLVKLPAFTVAASAAAQGISALAGGAVSLGSALAGPLASGAAAGAVGMTSLLQSAVTLKLASMGVGAALKDQITLHTRLAAGAKLSATQTATLNAKLEALPPAAREFVKYLSSLQPKLEQLRQAAGSNLFPGVTAGVKAAMANFGPLRRVIATTAEALGGLAKRAGELVGGKAFGADMQRIGNRNARIIGHLGNAFLSLVDAFTQVAVAAGPLTSWLAKGAERFAKVADSAAHAGRESGRMAAFFETARGTMSTLASMAGHLARGIFNIGKASAPLGRTMLHDLDRLTARFEAWTKSASGKNQIAHYFRSIKPPLYEAAGLVGDVAKAFGKLGGGSDTLTPLIKAVRKDLLPALVQVVQSTSSAFGPVLIEALTNFVKLFGSLAGTSGPLNIFVGTLSAFAGVLNTLLQSNPLVHDMAVQFIGLMAVMKGVKFIGAATGLTALSQAAMAAAGAYKALAAGATASAVAQEKGLGAMLAARAAMLLMAAGSGIAAAALWLLNAAMLAMPVILIVAALVAVGVGLYELYKHVKPVHDAIDWLWKGMQAVFGWIKDHWVLVASIIVGPFGAVAIQIVKHWSAIKNAVRTGAAAAVTVITAPFRWLVGTYFPHAWNDIKGPAGAAWHAIAGAIMGPVRAVAGVVRGAFGALAGWLASRWSGITSATSAGWRAIAGAVSGPLRAAAQVVRAVVGAVAGWLSSRWASIAKAAGIGWDAIRHAIGGPIRAAVGVVHDVIGGLVGWLAGRWSAINKRVSTWASSFKDTVTGAFRDVVGAVVKVVNAILWVIDKIPGVDVGRVKNPLSKTTGAPGTGKGNQAVAKMARGGAYASTGGLVKQPMVFMGEEAPRHPEFVIPTNPAYRRRAQGLLSKAAGAIGMGSGPVAGLAHGGMWSQGELAQLWSTVNPGVGDPKLMAAIAMAESGGNSQIVNSIGASGLWQIHPPEPGVLNPTTNARIAGRKLATQGLKAWEVYTNGSYRKFLGGSSGGQGGGGGLFGMFGKAAEWLVNGGKKLLGKLPDPKKMLPDWLQGMGKNVIGKAEGWIKRKVGGLVASVPNVIGGALGSVGSALGIGGKGGVGSFNGVPMANWVIEALKYAQSKGVDVRPTSGYRPGRDPHTASGRSEHQGTSYPHGAVDFGGYNSGGAMKMAVVNATRDFKHPLLAPIGFHDEGHASGTGHYRGGIFKAIAHFARGVSNGGGDTAKASGPTANVRKFAQRLWKLQTKLEDSPGPMPSLTFPNVPEAGKTAYADFQETRNNVEITKSMRAAFRNPKSVEHGYALESLVHEFAHARQRADVLAGDRRYTEGGAEMFAIAHTRELMKKMGVPFDNALGHAYAAERAFLKKQHTKPRWWNYDQFVHPGMKDYWGAESGPEVWGDKGKKKKKGFSSSAIPAFANGGLARGGLALVGERGPEIASLPRGTRIFSNAQTRSMGFRDGGAWGGMIKAAHSATDPWASMRKGLSALIGAQRGGGAPAAAAGGGAPAADQGLVAALATAVQAMHKKSPKLRAAGRKTLLDAIGKMQLPPSLTSSAGLAEAAVNVYGDYADRASSMSSTDNNTGVTIPGEFQNKTQGDWLGDQLSALLQWRNALIRIREWVEQHRAEVEKALAAAWAKYREVTAQLKALVARQAKVAKMHVWWTKSLAALRKHPKMNAIGIKYVKGKLANTKKQLDDMNKQMKPLGMVKASLEGSNGIVAALTGSRDALNSASGDALSSLNEVQGLGSPMNVMGSLPETGVLGGRILETQMQIRDLTAAAAQAADPNAGTSTTGADAQAALIKDLQDALTRSGLRNLDLQFMTQVQRFPLPAFASGGIAPGGLALVGERGPELAALPGGTRVSSATDTASMMAPTSIQVVVLDGAVDTNKIKVIANSEANVVVRREAQRGARSLPGRGGGIQYS
jgi:hypothetical protein